MDSDKRKLKTKKVVRRKSKREKKTENIEIEKIKGLGMSKLIFVSILLNCLFVCSLVCFFNHLSIHILKSKHHEK